MLKAAACLLGLPLALFLFGIGLAFELIGAFLCVALQLLALGLGAGLDILIEKVGLDGLYFGVIDVDEVYGLIVVDNLGDGRSASKWC